MKKRGTLIVIAGPTAVGKTAYSIALAQKLGTAIVSADSRQVYREMNIGTAKIRPEEMEGVPHFMLDLVSVRDRYTAGHFERDVLVLLDRLFESHSHVLLVGGSGLYIRAVTEGLDRFPEVPGELLQKRRQRFEREGLRPLLDELRQLDPDYYATVDRDNPARIIRALSVIDAGGLPFSFFMKKNATPRPFAVRSAQLSLPRALLCERINRRVNRMMDEGLLNEVRRLLPLREMPALQTVGYSELFEYLDGGTTLPEAVERIKAHSRQYAKRQVTWFNKYLPGPSFDARDTAAIDRYLTEDR